MPVIHASKKKISHRLTRHISLPILRAAYGFFLSLGAPLGWILIQYLANRSPFAAFDSLLYAYMTITTGILFSFIGYGIGKREEVITDMALSDSLTALYNKRYFKSRLEQEFTRFHRYGISMSLIQIDIDHFKQINDTWGHQAGDKILKDIGSIILANCRKNEIATRVGGEEICILATDTDITQAQALAERLRAAIEVHESHWQGEAIKVTVSCGVAQASDDYESAWQVYQLADDALYEAKRSGRNQVCVGGV